MFPAVVLIGNNRIVLEWYPKEDAIIPKDGKLRVRLREVSLCTFLL